jgi:hypothetical protein
VPLSDVSSVEPHAAIADPPIHANSLSDIVTFRLYLLADHG